MQRCCTVSLQSFLPTSATAGEPLGDQSVKIDSPFPWSLSCTAPPPPCCSWGEGGLVNILCLPASSWMNMELFIGPCVHSSLKHSKHREWIGASNRLSNRLSAVQLRQGMGILCPQSLSLFKKKKKDIGGLFRCPWTYAACVWAVHSHPHRDIRLGATISSLQPLCLNWHN